MNQIKLFFITITLIFINSSISFSSDAYNWKLYAKNSKSNFYYDDFAEAQRTRYYPIEGNYKYHIQIDSILLPIRYEYNETQTLVSETIRYSNVVSLRNFQCSGSYNYYILGDTYFSKTPYYNDEEGLISKNVSRQSRTDFTLETDKWTKKIVKKICKDFYPNGGKVYEVNKDKIYKKIENLNDIKNRTLVTSSGELKFKFFKDSVEIKNTYSYTSEKSILSKFEIRDDYIYIEGIKVGSFQDPITLNYALGLNSNGKIVLWEKINNEKYIDTNLIFEDNRVPTPKSERKSYANLNIDNYYGRKNIQLSKNKIVIFRDNSKISYSTYSFIEDQIHFTSRNNEGKTKDYAIQLDSNANDHHIWRVYVKDPNEQFWQFYIKNWRNGSYGKNIIKIDSKFIYP
jgi:hypothetical protein